MHTATLHTPNVAASRIPVYFAINHKKARRYVLCLEMVETMLQDFFPQQRAGSAPWLFRTLGQVACCIDNHLDDLDIRQKEQLFAIFPSFFDSLNEQQTETAFTDRLWNLCDQVKTSLYPPSLCTDLFQFHQFCSRQNLLPQLKAFSMAVIESAIGKTKAKNAKQVMQSLSLEGNAAVSFLLELLQKENRLQGSSKNFKRLKNYFSRLEKMLNIADDLSDYKKDKLKGTITLRAGVSYYFSLSARLFKTFFSTIFRYHFIFIKHFVVFTKRYIRSEMT